MEPDPINSTGSERTTQDTYSETATGKRRCLILPMPPSLNKYYRHVGNKVLISEVGRSYRDRLCRMIKNDRPLMQRIKMRVEVDKIDNRHRDLDNLLKCLLDSLTHANVYQDDSQIDDLRIVRTVDHDNDLDELFISLIKDA
jgi:crossover junction endodeoxyribonuclease RusA